MRNVRVHLPESSRRGVVIIYVAAVIGMLAVFGGTMVDTADNTLEAVQSTVFAQMARYAADSGVEWAVSAMNHELARPGGPYRNPFYGSAQIPIVPPFPPAPLLAPRDFNWLMFDSDGHSPPFAMFPPSFQGATGVQGISVRTLTSPNLDTAARAHWTSRASRHRLSFQLMVYPEFSFGNIRRKMEDGRLPEFYIQSLGIVRGERFQPVAVPPGTYYELLGHSLVVQKVQLIPRKRLSVAPFICADEGTPIVNKLNFEVNPPQRIGVSITAH